MNKIYMTSMILAIIMSFIISPGFEAVAASNHDVEKEFYITEDEFINLVYLNDFYLDFSSNFLDDKPYAFNKMTDENQNHIGYIIQYEIQYNESEIKHHNDVNLNYSSLLNFMYYFDNGVLETLLIDYSSLSETGNVTITDLNNPDLKETFYMGDINSDLIELEKEASQKLELKKAEIADSTDGFNIVGYDYIEEGVPVKPNADGPACWFCTKYESRGGTTDGMCSAAIGAACSVGKFQLFGRLLCWGATIVSCYIPKYQVCTQGYWTTTCPLP